MARQKGEYEKKKCQAQQLKRHLLQQLGETEIQVTYSIWIYIIIFSKINREQKLEKLLGERMMKN